MAMDIILMGIITRTGRIRIMATTMGLHTIGTAAIDTITATVIIIGTITGTKVM